MKQSLKQYCIKNKLDPQTTKDKLVELNWLNGDNTITEKGNEEGLKIYKYMGHKYIGFGKKLSDRLENILMQKKDIAHKNIFSSIVSFFKNMFAGDKKKGKKI